jgi:P4 family phage/plasmid primase-like protien
MGDDDEPRLSDKDITDAILADFKFFCDRSDNNLPLYVWTGDRWSNNMAEAVILEELANIFANEEERHKMIVSRTTDFIKGSTMNVKITPLPLNLIPVENGLFDITTKSLLPHDPCYFYTNVIPWNYDPAAKCPKWLDHLKGSMYRKDIKFFQEWVGYNLYRGYPRAAFLIMIGNGQNSKSIKMWVMAHLLGLDNVTDVSLADITYDGFKRAEVYQKLAVVADEIGSTEIKNAGWLRALSSGARVTFERKYGHPFDDDPYAKLTFACNEPPRIRDQSDAVKMRLHAIDFPFQFVIEPTNHRYHKKAREREEIHAELLAEMPGILNWALEGLIRLMLHRWKFTLSKSTEDVWTFYERRSNPVAAFSCEQTKLTDDETKVVFKEELWEAFQKWKEASKITLKITRAKFFRDLKELGIEPSQPAAFQGKRVYLGMILNPTLSSKPKKVMPPENFTALAQLYNRKTGKYPPCVMEKTKDRSSIGQDKKISCFAVVPTVTPPKSAPYDKPEVIDLSDKEG